MTVSRAYTHAVAGSLLPLVGMAAVAFGADVAVGTAVAGLAVVLHLVIGERVTRRFVLAAATQQDPAAIGRLMARQLSSIPLAALLVGTVGPVPSVLAFVSLGLGALVHAFVGALQAADARALAAHLEASC